MVNHKQFTSDEVSWSETTLFSSLIEDFKTLINTMSKFLFKELDI